VVNDYGLIARALDIVLQTGVYASVVNYVGSAPRNPNLVGLLREGMTGIRKAHPNALVVIGGPSSDEFRAEMDALGFLSYDDPSRAVRAIGALAWLAEQRDRTPPEPHAPARGDKLPDGPLSEREALAALAGAGVPVVETRLAADANAAVAAAKALGFPVAVKLASPDVLHKTEVGGVALGLATEEAVREAFDAIVARARKAVPGARIDGCLVAPMVSGGLECVLGIHRDPVFGPVVMFGLGGVFVEALRDVTFRVAPIDLAEARRMIGEIRAAKVLDGVRGKPPADREALAQALVRLSEFAIAHSHDLDGVDVNPFLVRAEGQGALALDAAFVRRTP
jgi:acyl-CoA synthetase (NDP forming)